MSDLFDQGMKSIFTRCEALVDHIKVKRKEMIQNGESSFKEKNIHCPIKSWEVNQVTDTFDFGKGLTVNRCKDALATLACAGAQGMSRAERPSHD